MVVLSRLWVLSALLGRWLRRRLLVVAFVGEIRFCFPGHGYVFITMETNGLSAAILDVEFFFVLILPGIQHVVESHAVWQVLGHRHAAVNPLEVPVGPAGVAFQLDSGVGWVGCVEDRDWASGSDAVEHVRFQVPLVG